jgi:hypothetical protein
LAGQQREQGDEGVKSWVPILLLSWLANKQTGPSFFGERLDFRRQA